MRRPNIAFVVWLGIVIVVSCAPNPPLVVPVATEIVSQPTLVPAPTATIAKTMAMVNTCGAADSTGKPLWLGQPGVVHLESGEKLSFCALTERDDVPRQISGLTLLGSIPDPDALWDAVGRPMQYLGVRDYAYLWRRSDGSSLALQALYPAWIGGRNRSTGGEVAPVLTLKPGADPRFVTSWQIEIISRESGQALLTQTNPFVAVQPSESFQLDMGVNFAYGHDTRADFITPHYELESHSAHDAIPVGVPLFIYTQFQPRDALQTLHGSVKINGQKHDLRTFSLYGSDVGFLGDMPTDHFVDEKGRALTLNGIQGFTFGWVKEDGKPVIMPNVYPGTVDGVQVAPVFLCDGCSDPHVLTDWEVWLVKLDNGEKVSVIKDPLVTLNVGESVEYDDETGYLQVVKRTREAYAHTGRSIGSQLPPLKPSGQVQGIRVFNYSREDIRGLEQVLVWLEQVTPQWHEYILSQRPIDLFYNPSLADRGISGTTACCWFNNSAKEIGHIELEARPPQPISDDLWFLVAFVHEATHVRDFRAKKFEAIRDVRTVCRATERSAVEVQHAFLKDLLKAQLDDKTRAAAVEQLKITEGFLADGTFGWISRCQ